MSVLVPRGAASSRTETLPRNPRKRLEKLEQQLAEIKRLESPPKCNCKSFTLAASAEYFEAEMNQTCPAHEFRRLGKINVMRAHIADGKGNFEDRSQGVPELVQEYERRLARHCQRTLEEDDPEEL